MPYARASIKLGGKFAEAADQAQKQPRFRGALRALTTVLAQKFSLIFSERVHSLAADLVEDFVDPALYVYLA